MASVWLVAAPVSLPGTLTQAPAWWQRGHTYALAAVAVVQVGLAWLMTRIAEEYVTSGRLQEIATGALLGLLFAQCFLLGLWAALGGLSTVPRWLIVGGLCAIGSAAVALQAATPGEELVGSVPQFVLLGWLTMAAFAVLLLPLRRLAGWRIDFDAAYHPSSGRRRGQMGMMDFVALSCAVAFPLTLCRCLIELEGNEDAQSLLIVPIIAALVLATAAPAAYAALARRRAGWWLAGTALWLVAFSWGQSVVEAHFPDLDFLGGSLHIWSMDAATLTFHVSVVLAVALPLGLLRLCGLKLLTVG